MPADLSDSDSVKQGQIDEKVLKCYDTNMKITVDVPDSELKEICRVTGIKKKGPAIRKLVEEALALKRREQLVRKFISGKWGAELKGFEQAQAIDARAESNRADRWRG